MPEMRICVRCGKNRQVKFYTGPKGTVCVSCQKFQRARTTHANRVKQTYGMDGGDYERLVFAQGGSCAICRGTRDYNLAVDHDHVTGYVRGLLCKLCNAHLLPASKDTPAILRAAADYLERPPAHGIIGLKRADIPDDGK